MFEFKPYQIELKEKVKNHLLQYKISYLVFETRLGKTSISLQACHEISPDTKILFITKRKAIESINKDISDLGLCKHVFVYSVDSVHNITPDIISQCDFVILDEAHCVGSFPKPGKRATQLKNIVKSKYLIYLSATPTPESYSQIFHQLWISDYSPFRQYQGRYAFYRWHDEYGIKDSTTKVRIAGGKEKETYKKTNHDKIDAVIAKYRLSFTKKEAGFEVSEINEQIIHFFYNFTTESIINGLVKKRIFDDPDIFDKKLVCLTNAEYMSKLHQLESGTIIVDDERFITDTAKVNYINENYRDKKICVFYKFIAEGEILRDYLKKKVVYTQDEFNSGDVNTCFISQFQSGREGVNLSTADVIIFYNVDHSFLSYEQTKNRIQHINRKEKGELHFLLIKDGIGEKILQVVKEKKNYTLSHFRGDYGKIRK